MAKIDTINKYMEQYLAGKSEKAIQRFREKDIDKQYQSIMTWRYNMRKRGVDVGDDREGKDIVDDLRGVRRRIDRCRVLDEELLDEVERELQSLIDYVQQTRRRLRVSEIERLESRRNEIEERLQTLRRQVEVPETPSLFDIQ